MAGDEASEVSEISSKPWMLSPSSSWASGEQRRGRCRVRHGEQRGGDVARPGDETQHTAAVVVDASVPSLPMKSCFQS